MYNEEWIIPKKKKIAEFICITYFGVRLCFLKINAKNKNIQKNKSEIINMDLRAYLRERKKFVKQFCFLFFVFSQHWLMQNNVVNDSGNYFVVKRRIIEVQLKSFHSWESGSEYWNNLLFDEIL